MSLSQALAIKENEIVTVVGAGGKSSLLMSLSREWRESKRPFLLTATTKMFVEQVMGNAPVFCPDYEEGVQKLLQNLASRGYASWFKGRSGEMALGVEPGWIDEFYLQHQDRVANIIIEGDGARGRLLKIPGPWEPVVPGLCHRIIGVMNLQAVGRELSPENIHRFELTVPFLGRNEGRIQPRDLVALALHPEGIFKNSSAKKVVVLSGADEKNTGLAAELAQSLVRSRNKFTACVVTRGFNEQVRPVAIYKAQEDND